MWFTKLLGKTRNFYKIFNKQIQATRIKSHPNVKVIRQTKIISQRGHPNSTKEVKGWNVEVWHLGDIALTFGLGLSDQAVWRKPHTCHIPNPSHGNESRRDWSKYSCVWRKLCNWPSCRWKVPSFLTFRIPRSPLILFIRVLPTG